MHTSELLGKQVMDKNGNNVGKVVDIDINLPQWTVNHIILKIGMIKKLPIGIDIIDKIGDKIILKTAKDELRKSN
jgi:sporulation protein YlmC with PRC-barrel domain